MSEKIVFGANLPAGNQKGRRRQVAPSEGSLKGRVCRAEGRGSK